MYNIPTYKFTLRKLKRFYRDSGISGNGKTINTGDFVFVNDTGNSIVIGKIIEFSKDNARILTSNLDVIIVFDNNIIKMEIPERFITSINNINEHYDKIISIYEGRV